MSDLDKDTPDQQVSGPHLLLPEKIREYRTEIDEAIKSVLSEKPDLEYLTIDAVMRGRKLRSTMALQFLEWTGWELPAEKRVQLLRDLVRIELLHTASCIFDDLIDKDNIRRGVPAFHVRHSESEAILTGLFLTCSSLHDKDSIELANRILYGEFCENQLFAKHGLDQYDDPISAYFEKTAPLFALAHKLVARHADRNEVETEKSYKYGEKLGTYYQAANDHHDLFTIEPSVRGDMEDQVPVNFSVPIYLYMQKKPEHKNLLGKNITRNQLALMIQEMRELGIEEESAAFLDRTKQEIISVFPGPQCPEELHKLLGIINTSKFWSYKYK